MTAIAKQDSSVAPAVPAPQPARKPRLAPLLVLVIAYWLGWFVVQAAFDQLPQFLYKFWAPMLLAVAMLAWWLPFSRTQWFDRLWAVFWLVVGAGMAYVLIDKSMLFGLIMNALPVALTACVVWLVVMRGAATWPMRLGLVAASLLSWGYFTLIRIDGINGDMAAAQSWRWTPTAEYKYLLTVNNVSATPAAAKPVDLVATDADWPEFRGARRDGVVHGIRFDADWTAHPPRELWRHLVGPGWSSVAAVGGFGFTQEQRGDQEAVVCLDLATGREAWVHLDSARFWEVVAGAGPRATPTFHEGKIYTQGASGKLNCLDAASGDVLWTRDIAAEASVKPPAWGFAGSPLVTHGRVIAYAGGAKGKGVLAYDAVSGEPAWSAGKATHSYSSPQLFQSGGSDQVLIVSDHGLESFDPETGKLLWDHEWYLQGFFRVCQPNVTGDSQVLIGTGMSYGTRLLTVERAGSAWEVTEKWTSKDLKPYFNDFVIHDGYAYGFDDAIFTCIDLATGKKQWKKGRYGHGQVLLVKDQGLLVIVGEEKGEVVLVEANPASLVERGRFAALTGKTWNHPVIAANKLLVRNDEEMACYELSPAPSSGVAGR